MASISRKTKEIDEDDDFEAEKLAFYRSLLLNTNSEESNTKSEDIDPPQTSDNNSSDNDEQNVTNKATPAPIKLPRLPADKKKQKKPSKKKLQLNGRALDELDTDNASVNTVPEDVLTHREKQQAKKQKQREIEKLMNEERKKREKEIKNPLLTTAANIDLARKTSQAVELDKLIFQAKQFVVTSTAKTVEEKKKFAIEEMRRQGKVPQQRLKNEAKNYKELMEELKQKRAEEKANIQREKDLDIFNFKKNRIDNSIARSKKLGDKRKIQSLYGAPDQIGKNSTKTKLRSKAVGSVGNWKKGTLVLSKMDVQRITRDFSESKNKRRKKN